MVSARPLVCPWSWSLVISFSKSTARAHLNRRKGGAVSKGVCTWHCAPMHPPSSLHFLLTAGTTARWINSPRPGDLHASFSRSFRRAWQPWCVMSRCAILRAVVPSVSSRHGEQACLWVMSFRAISFRVCHVKWEWSSGICQPKSSPLPVASSATAACGCLFRQLEKGRGG